ncbi:hypothetical protein ACFW1A_28175 [Kitasatospora sp. NPDC058965]|uniref:hypothetical protein n=1 Tax=Kitasatospora sp. NPDC058965 TaxID=3346682 RepID=UPI0036AB1185
MTSSQYELRAEHRVAPAAAGGAQRGPVHLWHICPAGRPVALCGEPLEPDAEVRPMSEWATRLPGDESITVTRRCAACADAYAAARWGSGAE